ncbi:MAG: carboxypeptidase regulatory-like domain-containing protein [Chitinispirillaceae bacterium]|nr:carboxypeptidase regulatory-like domain-containing protein [Chitinispirillaceae bacterium]
MKLFSFTKNVSLFIISMVCMSFAVQRTIAVSGVVIDSVRDQPIQKAMVLLHDSQGIPDINNMNGLSFDTVFTSSNGSFSYVMEIESTSNIMFYVLLKEMYAPKISYELLLGVTTSIALDTLLLVPSNLSGKDTVVVSGTVVDSVNGQGIAGALVGLMGGDLDTVGKTVVTGADGLFSKQIIVNTVTIELAGTFTFVAFGVVKDGYAPATGIKMANGQTVDLDTIRLSPSTSIRWNGFTRNPLSVNANSMSVYSLNGRLLYTGPIISSDRIARHSSGAVMVDLKYSGTSVGKKKFVPMR